MDPNSLIGKRININSGIEVKFDPPGDPAQAAFADAHKPAQATRPAASPRSAAAAAPPPKPSKPTTRQLEFCASLSNQELHKLTSAPGTAGDAALTVLAERQKLSAAGKRGRVSRELARKIAEAEAAADPKAVAKFSSRERFISIRIAELTGQLTSIVG
jgi:hypothetical protein